MRFEKKKNMPTNVSNEGAVPLAAAFAAHGSELTREPPSAVPASGRGIFVVAEAPAHRSRSTGWAFMRNQFAARAE